MLAKNSSFHPHTTYVYIYILVGMALLYLKTPLCYSTLVRVVNDVHVATLQMYELLCMYEHVVATVHMCELLWTHMLWHCTHVRLFMYVYVVATVHIYKLLCINMLLLLYTCTSCYVRICCCYCAHIQVVMHKHVVATVHMYELLCTYMLLLLYTCTSCYGYMLFASVHMCEMLCTYMLLPIHSSFYLSSQATDYIVIEPTT
jgi:hypothetical protein